jgi:hypothetical protein
MTAGPYLPTGHRPTPGGAILPYRVPPFVGSPLGGRSRSGHGFELENSRESRVERLAQAHSETEDRT